MTMSITFFLFCFIIALTFAFYIIFHHRHQKQIKVNQLENKSLEYNNKGINLTDSQQYDDAIEAFTRAIEIYTGRSLQTKHIIVC